MTVVSASSYFNFTPLLASCATGTLEFRCTIEPVRRYSPEAVITLFAFFGEIGSFSTYGYSILFRRGATRSISSGRLSLVCAPFSVSCGYVLILTYRRYQLRSSPHASSVHRRHRIQNQLRRRAKTQNLLYLMTSSSSLLAVTRKVRVSHSLRMQTIS